LTPLGVVRGGFHPANRATLHMVPMLAFVAVALVASSQVTAEAAG